MALVYPFILVVFAISKMVLRTSATMPLASQIVYFEFNVNVDVVAHANADARVWRIAQTRVQTTTCTCTQSTTAGQYIPASAGQQPQASVAFGSITTGGSEQPCF